MIHRQRSLGLRVLRYVAALYVRAVTGALLTVNLASGAQFDPETLSMSTVKVVIKSTEGVKGVATGFVWQTPSQIVTSLHVLGSHPNAQIIIEFNKKRRRASVSKILPEADLVLLTVSRPLKNWQPLRAFQTEKPTYRASVTALGFNRGALAMSTRELLKGYAKPEVLKQFLPPNAVEKLSVSNIPDINLPIYYLDGSLLPGFSGAPVFDREGQLIGIGNGGLEDGAASVSWVIPAYHLTNLVHSPIVQLPKLLNISASVFTLDTQAVHAYKAYVPPFKPRFKDLFLPSVYASNPREMRPLISSSEPIRVTQVRYKNYLFTKVKTRSLAQLLASSARPAEIHRAVVLFTKIFNGRGIDFSNTQFDVYTDAYYGINLVVPHGASLIVDDNGYLVTQSTHLCRLCPYELQFHGQTLDKVDRRNMLSQPLVFMRERLNDHAKELNEEGEFFEYTDFQTIRHFGDRRYVLNSVFANFNEPFVENYELNYLLIATNRDNWFQAQAINTAFSDDYLKKLVRYQGVNCSAISLTQDQIAFCNSIDVAFSTFMSAHLMGFSNRFYP
ncbi:hypothetical protein BGP78_01515 [Pseudoalteromonas sp. MSK9-3]|uniref:S1 family peptidase n=1 Tax=Pseudoalteromonas sp. MSK9-3 TaxID=1897633 RepID=UPI000E6C7588|nr:serine protease [Pseudoalteromonas sp. MSK9-3]RJE76953.1 hypothetical protein BGP78_01515 [Pseudoalteromonas sp. MSK9-3]